MAVCVWIFILLIKYRPIRPIYWQQLRTQCTELMNILWAVENIFQVDENIFEQINRLLSRWKYRLRSWCHEIMNMNCEFDENKSSWLSYKPPQFFYASTLSQLDINDDQTLLHFSLEYEKNWKEIEQLSGVHHFNLSNNELLSEQEKMTL